MSPRPPDELCVCKHPKQEHLEKTFPITKGTYLLVIDYGACKAEDCKCENYDSMIKY